MKQSDTNRLNPWLGLQTYQEGQIIYGRTDDINSLTQFIDQNVLTVLYGKSGIGKSSLLNAGVSPLLRRMGMFPVNIRLTFEQGQYLDQIDYTIKKALSSLRYESFDSKGQKIISFKLGSVSNLKSGLDVIPPSSSVDFAISSSPWNRFSTSFDNVYHRTNENEDLSKISLWEYFHTRTFHDSEGKRIYPVLIFDQFEEVFTIESDRKRRDAFFRELADLINDVRPASLDCKSVPEGAPQYTANDIASMFSSLDSFQSEDYYLSSQDFKIVFSIREDFLSYLDRRSSFIPSMQLNRFCLQPINEEQASQIIMNPVPGLVEPEVAKLIIEKITGDKSFDLDGIPEINFDSAILSLYLSRLYNGLTVGENAITSRHVELQATSIISGFYEESIAEIPEEIVNFLEDNLINGDGRRDNISMFTARTKGHLTDDVITKLVVERKLLRQFEYEGLRLEFIHDILCPVIVNRKENRKLLKERAEQARRIELEAEKQAEQAQKIGNEKLLLEKKNRKFFKTVIVVAAFLLSWLLSIVYMSFNNSRQKEYLLDLNSEINGLLPYVIEGSINDGDKIHASHLFMRLYGSEDLFQDKKSVTLLRKISATTAIVYEGHSQSVNAVQFSPDGKVVASGSDDGTIQFWNPDDGRNIASLFGEGSIQSIDFSVDGASIVFSTKNGHVSVARIGDLKIVNTITQNKYSRYVRFSPDGKKIIACGTDGIIYIYDAKNNLSVIDKIKLNATSVAFADDGSRVAIAGSDHMIHIMDLDTKKSYLTLKGHSDWVRSVEFDKSGQNLLSSSDDKTVRLWSLVSGASKTVATFSHWCTKASFSKDGNYIVATSKDGNYRVFDSESFDEIPEYQKKYKTTINSFAFSSDGKRVAIASTEPIIHVWDCVSRFDTGIQMNQRGAIYGLGYIPGTETFASVDNEGELAIWNYKTGQKKASIPLNEGNNSGRANSLDVSKDGRYIALSTKSNVRLFELPSYKEVILNADDYGHNGWIRNVRFSPDGKYLASVAEDGKILLWDMSTKKSIAAKTFAGEGLYSVSFTPGGDRLSIGSTNNSIRQLTVPGLELDSLEYSGHSKTVCGLNYSKDAEFVLSSSYDMTAILWNKEGLSIKQYVGASGFMNESLFSKDEREIITASSDKLLRLWNTDSQEESIQLTGHQVAVSRLCLTEDNYLISGDNVGKIKVWKIPSLEEAYDEIKLLDQQLIN